MVLEQRKRCWWGWGYQDAQLNQQEIQNLSKAVSNLSQLEKPIDPPKPSDLHLPDPKLKPPKEFNSFSTIDPLERIRHSAGSSFIDVTKKLNLLIKEYPDLVIYPETEQQVIKVLDWAKSKNIAVIVYGAGSSVVGGVSTEGSWRDDFSGVISLDLAKLNQVIEVDRVSQAARIQAGIYGPELENSLRNFGLTLRHFPQSFECSSLGGWIATRSGGHYATGPTHIDDFVESIRAITPRGIFESRRLPGSGAGPSPDRFWLGSEGTFGVITEAWIRLQKRVIFRSSLEAHFNTFEQGYLATKALIQSGLRPANCRLIEATEALINGVSDGKTHILLVGFESADFDTSYLLKQASEILKENSAQIKNEKTTKTAQEQSSDAAKAWRNSFIKAPYTRDALVRLGVIVDTFETAITWDKFESFHEKVTAETKEAINSAADNVGLVTCRFTHVYPDGPAPYYSVVAKGKLKAQDRIKQWQDIKAQASEAVIENGGTITHHHAIGRDHVPYYQLQIPRLHIESLSSIKKLYDPQNILNPGILGI
jgi:alkyldihydroxyacetonephosphate synthase